MATTYQELQKDLQTFPHRHNADGTYDSICPNCYRTTAKQGLESNLAQFEQTHRCLRRRRSARVSGVINRLWGQY